MPSTDFPSLRQIYDRDWHIVVENSELAHIYEKFIKWDAQQAKPLEVTGSALALEAPTGSDLFLGIPEELAAAAGNPQFFAAQTFIFAKDEIKIQPLLTPDNYEPNILQLIQSAKKTLYFQNQYIKIPKDDTGLLRQLIDALKERIAAKVDVRIILRGDFDFRPMLEALVSDGFPPKVLKAQKALHNKGIIVDSKLVAIGSENWSEDGVGPNRDATVIVQNAKVAAYYEKIFLDDWSELATQSVATADAAMAIVTAATDAVHPGTARVPWGAVYDE